MTHCGWTVSNIGDVKVKLHLNPSLKTRSPMSVIPEESFSGLTRESFFVRDIRTAAAKKGSRVKPENDSPQSSARALRLLAFASLALAASPAAFAQTTSDAVIVTGNPTPIAPEKLGQTITVISGEQIEDAGYIYVSDVLRMVPSVAVSQPGAPGALTQVRVRGAEANHTLVLIDGIDISSPDQGETDFSTLLPGDLDRIEILRGPQSGLYGSNALAGVVNLISRTDIDKTYLNASVEAGSFETVAIEASAGTGNGEDDYLAASASHVTSEGYDISPDQTANGVPFVGVGGEAGDEEGNEVTSINLRGGKRINGAVRLTGIARYVTKDSETDGQAFGFPISGQTYDDASQTSHEQLTFGASAIIDPWDGAWETTLSASHVDESRRSRLTDFPFLFGPPAPTPAELAALPLFDSGSDSTRFRLGAVSTVRFGDDMLRHFVTAFAEHEEETYKDPFISRDESRTLQAIGLQYRNEIAEQLYLSATIRHDANDDFQDIETYSLSAAWQIPNTGTRLHSSYGTGVTAPTFIEQFGFTPGFFTGNANLVPEESIGWDFGVEQSLFEEALILDLTYFSAELENEIFTDFSGPLPTPLNSTSDSDRSGWELTVSANPLEDLSIYGAYSQLDATEPAGIEIRRPKEQASLDLNWDILGSPFQLNLGVTHVGENIDTDFATFLRTPLDPYTTIRLGGSWQVTDQFELYARAENLTDEDYQEVIGYNAAPQAFYVGLRFRDEAAK
jgi:vitamin B12 transporter